MIKPPLLRHAIEQTIPELKTNPDKLLMFVEDGQIVGTGAQSASFEYRYWLTIILTDFAYPLDVLIVPIMDFVRRNQPEIVENPSLREKSIQFTTEQLNHDTADIEIKIRLTEAVRVAEQDGVNLINHLAEPPLYEWAEVEKWKLFVKGELVRESE
ncbi:phage tail protein [Testudinibacter aquarius]|uniref:Phage tail protein n=1 Tax=Testudinibacter aquarius TaxID=1524974 RepID=A0A4R3Y9F5_9PAST|nr:phage tail protein [Testudinibacter aquarius]KAE9526071.1 hypothetical protein A1D24_03295 [Testudinibacter aquarius]TCV87264.1 tail completion protein R (GpR) [Testudinibacter aquarius]TNG87524.1 phage tail protein [Testudinibacter aquarius]